MPGNAGVLKKYFVLINGKIGRLKKAHHWGRYAPKTEVKIFKKFSVCFDLFIKWLEGKLKKVDKIFVTGSWMLKIKPALLHS
ncbi:hypothetical protein LZD49_12605, partial [Dyadobacter sp. CY261]|uniref:hypothetical protein n=1 Tax=Dyadobacter sp. CY261 TaxID=2907203 RepID=UPI001F382C0B